MTSEEKYEISKQPDEACPLVDEAIGLIKEALDDLKGWDKMDLDDLQSACDYAEWRLGNIDLEPLRQRASEIRNWGQEWKDRALELLSDNRRVGVPPNNPNQSTTL